MRSPEQIRLAYILGITILFFLLGSITVVFPSLRAIYKFYGKPIEPGRDSGTNNSIIWEHPGKTSPAEFIHRYFPDLIVRNLSSKESKESKGAIRIRKHSLTLEGSLESLVRLQHSIDTSNFNLAVRSNRIYKSRSRKVHRSELILVELIEP